MFVTVQRSDGDTTIVGIESYKLLSYVFDFIVLAKKLDMFVYG